MERTAERALVARLKAGDPAAFQQLAEQYGGRIYQLAFRYMKNQEDAEEVTQDVLMKVYRKIDRFRGNAALSSWIYRITFNTAMSRLRSGRAERIAAQGRERLEAATAGGAAPPEPADWSLMPDEALLRRQFRGVIAEALEEMPEMYRAPIVLRDIEGLTTGEASSRLRLKDQTLKSRLHRGRLMLRQKLRAFTSGLSMHQPTPACC